MTQTEKIRKLQTLTALALEADLAKLRVLTSKEQELRTAYLNLSPERVKTESSISPSDAQNFELYRIWCERRRLEINQQLALVLAQINTRRAAARLTFGRDAVMKKLALSAK